MGSPRVGGVRRFAVLAVATAAGAGLAPVAPGTFGSLVGVGVFALIAPRGALAAALAALLVAAVGVWAAGEAERIFAHEDDGRIAIDEVAGQLVTLWPLSLLAAPERAVAPLPLAVGFFVFRAFDIAKPGPVRWAERHFTGGRGVVFDDLVAGACAALVVAGAALAGIAS
ncbi:MAG TPA: phosphatidylglycerophosphatase A [Myxococcota bacterium]|nr:phosphatidylglycerophosphatase A [Myxococcota bacterium]